MIKTVEITFINHDKSNSECISNYKVDAKNNNKALDEALKLFITQAYANKNNYEITNIKIY